MTSAARSSGWIATEMRSGSARAERKSVQLKGSRMWT